MESAASSLDHDVMTDAGSMTAVVLAAGRASRMGEEKLLLPLGGAPVIRHVVEAVLAARPRETIVVVNPRNRDAIVGALRGLDPRVVCNDRFADGIATSIAAGVAAASAASEGVILVQGDQPFVTTDMLLALVAAWQEERPAFVAASYGGLRTTPVLFARALYPELRALEGDVGARSVLARHRGATVAFPEAAGSDLDTKADYQAVRAVWSSKEDIRKRMRKRRS